MKLNIYTDGACTQDGNGGYSVYFKELNILITNKEKNTTNNKMELTAILTAIQTIQYLPNWQFDDSIEIYTDSQYCINTITNKWNAIENKDLIELIQSNQYILESITGVDVNFNWVKGHSTDKNNNLVDIFANYRSNENK